MVLIIINHKTKDIVIRVFAKQISVCYPVVIMSLTKDEGRVSKKTHLNSDVTKKKITLCLSAFVAKTHPN
jgi:hypothetical protein